jgi:hypothetical protein
LRRASFFDRAPDGDSLLEGQERWRNIGTLIKIGNSKFEARISKQIRMTKMQNVTLWDKQVLKIGNFGIVSDFDIRIFNFVRRGDQDAG